MTVLDRKLLRDIKRIWAQILAISLVMACGVMTLVLASGVFRSLDETRVAFYDRYGFGHVFSHAVRAPRSIGARIGEISGVADVALRVTAPVVVDVAQMVEPASGLVIGLPVGAQPRINKLYLRSGRLPDGHNTQDVAVLESFAEAHGFGIGDRFNIVLNGQKFTLRIVGVVLSPEFIYSIGPGDMIPDQRRFGVFYLSERVLNAVLNMDGAFNSVVLRLRRGVQRQPVIDQLDDLLEPYGGGGAISRKDQMSHAFLSQELEQLRGMANVIPPIFLFVSAFLVNMILGRLIALEREQVGLLKAVGYSRSAIAWHYGKLVLFIAGVGLVIGMIAGAVLGRGLTVLYSEFFSFPFLVFKQSIDLYAIAAMASVAAALLGGARAVFGVLRLPAAVAMRAPAPTRYRSIFGGYRWSRVFSQLTIMAVRHLARWPVRTGLTILGTSFSVALLITALFSIDAINEMIEVQYFQAERQDISVQFVHGQRLDLVNDIANMPGVLRVEPYRATQVEIRSGHVSKQLAIVGYANAAELGRILKSDGSVTDPPDSGIMLSRRVANQLGVVRGDRVELELLQHEGRTVTVAVTDVIKNFIGLVAYMHNDALHEMIGDGKRFNGARIAVDAAKLPAFYRASKSTPLIGSVTLLDVSRQKFRETMGENISIMTTVYVVIAVIITFGVIYNSARIQLSERARELASLRVLGFTRAEVSSIMFIELGTIAALAQPVGWLLGYWFSLAVLQGFESDLFQIPFVAETDTFALSSSVVLVAALISIMVVRRRIDKLDLVSVLKTRE